MNTKKQDDPVERIHEHEALDLMTKLRRRAEVHDRIASAIEERFEDEANGRSEAEVLAFLESLVRRNVT